MLKAELLSYHQNFYPFTMPFIQKNNLRGVTNLAVKTQVR